MATYCFRAKRRQLTELIPHLHSLPREDKLRALQLLTADLAHEPQSDLLEAGQSYSEWAPWDAHEAASVLLQLLQTEKGTR
jgi:hypothetical protein